MLEPSSLVQADHEGAGQVPLDGEHRGGDAQVRDGAEEKARRARDRCRRARRGRDARPYPRQPAPGAVARAVVGPERRARGPVVLDDLSLSRGGYDGMTNMELRRKVDYRPRRRAPEPRGYAALAPQVVRRVPRARGRRVRLGLGDAHRRGHAGGQHQPTHAAVPPQ